MSVRIQDMAPGAREHAEAAVVDLIASGIPHVITSTRRNVLEQMAFWLQSRAPLEAVNLLRQFIGIRLLTPGENLYERNRPKLAAGQPLILGVDVITLADGVNTPSNHQDGNAIDIVPAGMNGGPIWPKSDDPRWRKIAEVMKRHGFESGLDWANQDPPHHKWKGV